MSVLGKKWLIKNHTKDKPTIEKILENRGLNSLEQNLEFHDPFLFSDMEKAVSRIDLAVKNSEKIIIFGDYDVDGISGTAILWHVLSKIKADVSCRLPNRVSDGYGLAEKFIDEFEKSNVSLIITVDCGISSAKVISYAKKKNIDTIITDHHSIPENIPLDAIAILHPQKDQNYPYRGLTGAGVAFKLAQALIQRYLPLQNDFLDSLIDLASLGTIADLGPLTGENRTIVKKGLTQLKKTRWGGLKKLLDLSEIKEDSKIDTRTVGFRIAPRINAAGRIGDPYTALSLLIQEDHSEKIQSLGQELDDLNTKRQDMTFSAVTEAEQYFLSLEKLPFILIAENQNWHVGVLGLVAGRLTEKYARPAIVLQDFGDTLVASARSPKYFNITEALSATSRYLISFGGHAQAAGFNLKKENYQKFKEEISAYAKEKLADIELMPTLDIDCEIFGEEVCFDLLEKLEALEPFGVANLKPTFLLNNVEAHFIDQVGKEGSHLKFTLQLARNNINVIAFNMGQHAEEMRKHKKINLVCQLDRNKWGNRDYLNLQGLDFQFIVDERSESLSN